MWGAGDTGADAISLTNANSVFANETYTSFALFVLQNSRPVVVKARSQVN
jgi:hypothetical protein